MGGISLASIKIAEFEAWIRGLIRDEIDRGKQSVSDRAAAKAAHEAHAIQAAEARTARVLKAEEDLRIADAAKVEKALSAAEVVKAAELVKDAKEVYAAEKAKNAEVAKADKALKAAEAVKAEKAEMAKIAIKAAEESKDAKAVYAVESAKNAEVAKAKKKLRDAEEELAEKESKIARAVKTAFIALLALGLSVPLLARAEEPLGAQTYAAKRVILLPAVGAAPVSAKPDTSADGRFYSFDPDADEACWYPAITLPHDVTPNQTAEFRVTWSAATTVAGVVYWNVSYRTGANAGAMGSWSVLTMVDTNTGTSYPNVSDWATLATNLEPNQLLDLKVTRDADYSGDTLNKQDALFQQLDVKISETIRN